MLAAESVAAAIQQAVQGALQLGTLELPPCTSDEEWHAFRGGLNELVYTRFGLVVEDCVPVDLHPTIDFAAQLLAASPVVYAPAPAPAPVFTPEPPSTSVSAPAPERAPAQASAPAPDARTDADADAAALRRLFLELPALAAGMRALPMQEGDGSFAPMQGILRRLALAAVNANTMPSLTHSAPSRRLPEKTQQLRATHALAAQSALDEGWALLASMRSGLEPAKLDDTGRMLSNLEHSLAQRRSTQP